MAHWIWLDCVTLWSNAATGPIISVLVPAASVDQNEVVVDDKESYCYTLGGTVLYLLIMTIKTKQWKKNVVWRKIHVCYCLVAVYSTKASLCLREQIVFLCLCPSWPLGGTPAEQNRACYLYKRVLVLHLLNIFRSLN